MLTIFNNLSILGKSLVILLIIMVIVLIALIIYLCVKNKKNNDMKIDNDFFDELKNQDNTKSIFVDDVDINKVNEVAKKIEPEIKNGTNNTNIDEDKQEVSEKFDISKAAKQMEEDIESSNIDLTEYEVEQEEKAIISYTELLNKVKQNTSSSNVKVNIQEVDLNIPKEEFNYNTEILDFSDLNDSKAKEETSTLFKQDDIKEMLSIKDIDNSLYSSDEFLKALKDLRDSLE